MYAGIIVDLKTSKLDKTFTYHVPSAMEKDVHIGSEVIIPFGRGNKNVRGYVVTLSDTCGYPREKVKELLGMGDGEDVAARSVALAAWIRQTCGGTMIQALRTVLPVRKKVRVRKKRFVERTVSEAEARERLAFYRKKHQNARARLMEALLCDAAIPYAFLGNLGVTKSVTDHFEKEGLARVIEEEKPMPERQKIPLNRAQQDAFLAFQKNYRRGQRKTYLLYGVTGSGKTEVYMEMISEVLSDKKSAIVLIPEIALTFQMVMRFRRRFGDRIAVMHSRLSDGEKYAEMEKARRGEVDVMIGPRSALFAPLKNLGLIIIDEEHEESYKSGQVPKYHARDVAEKLASLTGASVILGSATPSLGSMYKATTGAYELLMLRERVAKSTLPETVVVDMREERRSGNRGLLSDELVSSLITTLNRGEQAMIFLNRRGYLGVLSCKACGEVVLCPHCDVALTEHRGGVYRCHYCGYEKRDIQACPVCGSADIGGLKAGTEQVEEVIKAQFPKARVLRMDRDTTRGKGDHAKILQAFMEREADILIGTQMIVKGHDFPHVTLVGVLAADMSLYAGDYRSGERTFALLVQAAGRAGRSAVPGKAVIQTFQPDHYVITHAARQDYAGFYREEMAFRDLCGYPPLREMVSVRLLCENETHLQQAAGYLKKYCDLLKETAGSGAMTVLGPLTPQIAKVKDIYRQDLLLKSPDKRRLVWAKDQMEKYIEMNSGYRNITVQFDFHPV